MEFDAGYELSAGSLTKRARVQGNFLVAGLLRMATLPWAFGDEVSLISSAEIMNQPAAALHEA